MQKKSLKIINIQDEWLQIILVQNEEILDYISTNEKYTKEVEDILYRKYNHGFISENQEKRYGIPGYIRNNDIINWNLDKFLYLEKQKTISYPEAYNEKISKQYTKSFHR